MESSNTQMADLPQNMKQDASHSSFCEAASRSQRKKAIMFLMLFSHS